MVKAHTFSIGLIIAIVTSLLLPAAWAQQPKPGGTLRVAWEADVTGLDPHLSTGIQAYFVMGNLFNSLVTIDAELNYVPELAESWDVLEDGKVYVFHLRQGVKFHDGTDFDAEAVRWNYQRIMNPEERAIDVGFYSIVEAVEVVDPHTVKFILKHPSATLLPVMAANRAGFLQMSPASYAHWGRENVRLHPVGTGPFTLVRWDQNQIIVLEKNPHYFKPGLPYLDRIELRIMKEGVTRVTSLRTGEVDFANAVPREHMDRLTRDAKIQMLKGRATQRISTQFNQRQPAFQDVRVRQALLGYSIDRQAIAKTALLGLAEPLWSFVPSGSKGHIDFGELYPYDPDKAKALLKEAGQENLQITFAGQPQVATQVRTGEVLRSQLAKGGIDMRIQNYEPAQWFEQLATKKYDLTSTYWSATLDPVHLYLPVNYSKSPWNFPANKNARIDAALEKFAYSTDEAARKSAYPEVVMAVAEEAPIIFLTNEIQRYWTQDDVKGSVPLPSLEIRAEDMWHES
jgi:peptide/nickel transport system substrate-binding protein